MSLEFLYFFLSDHSAGDVCSSFSVHICFSHYVELHNVRCCLNGRYLRPAVVVSRTTLDVNVHMSAYLATDFERVAQNIFSFFLRINGNSLWGARICDARKPNISHSKFQTNDWILTWKKRQTLNLRLAIPEMLAQNIEPNRTVNSQAGSFVVSGYVCALAPRRTLEFTVFQGQLFIFSTVLVPYSQLFLSCEQA